MYAIRSYYVFSKIQIMDYLRIKFCINEMLPLKYKKNDIEDVAYFEPFYLKDFVIIPAKNVITSYSIHYTKLYDTLQRIRLVWNLALYFGTL